MKKLIYLFILSYSFTVLQAQNYVITFSASGASDTVDSIYVENITQGVGVKISGTDTLIPAIPESVEELAFENQGLRLYPNPTFETCTFNFYSSSGNVNIELFTITGQRVLSKIFALEGAGIQCFELNGIHMGAYILKVRTSDEQYIGRILSIVKNDSQTDIKYKETVNRNKEVKILKNAKGGIVIPYNPGDILLFEGTSGNYSTILTLIPTQNEVVNFEFVPCTDADGNNYPVVKIGQQLWMGNNLKTSKYKNGVVIPNITDSLSWSFQSNPAFCWYNNDSVTYHYYGNLYNWLAVKDTQKICPTGWHLPKDGEWITLTNYLGTESVAGGMLKETSTIHWEDPNTDATNETGFTFLPGGMRNNNAKYENIRQNGICWSSTEIDNDNSWVRVLFYDNGEVLRNQGNKKNGFSVRCIYGDLPVVSTDSVTNITNNTASCGGNIISNGGIPITQYGICWSTSSNPTLLNNYTNLGNGIIGAFTSNMLGLNYNVTYYVRAYASNNAGTSYGNQKIFITVSPYYIGQSFGGGIIFYIDWTGIHGLVADTCDLEPVKQWGCYDSNMGASGLTIGTGQSNSSAIINGCNQPGIAAKACDSLTRGNYTDWYLPSIYELTELYNKSSLIGGFDYSARYWSSSEFNSAESWYRPFYSGFTAHYSSKSDSYKVRAIRSF